MSLIRPKIKILCNIPTKLTQWRLVPGQEVPKITTIRTSVQYYQSRNLSSLNRTSFCSTGRRPPFRSFDGNRPFCEKNATEGESKCNSKKVDCSSSLPTESQEKGDKQFDKRCEPSDDKVYNEVPSGRDCSLCGRKINLPDKLDTSECNEKQWKPATLTQDKQLETKSCNEKPAISIKQNEVSETKPCKEKPDISLKQDEVSKFSKCISKTVDCSSSKKEDKQCENVCNNEAPMGRDYSPCGRYFNTECNDTQKKPVIATRTNKLKTKSCKKQSAIPNTQDELNVSFSTSDKCPKIRFKCVEAEENKDCDTEIPEGAKICPKMSFQCRAVSDTQLNNNEKCISKDLNKEKKCSKVKVSCKKMAKFCTKKKGKKKQKSKLHGNKNKQQKKQKLHRSKSGMKQCDKKYKQSACSKAKMVKSTPSLWQTIKVALGFGQNSIKKFSTSSEKPHKPCGEEDGSSKKPARTLPEHKVCESEKKQDTEIKPFFVCKEHPNSCNREDPSIARSASYLSPLPDCICREEPQSPTCEVTPCPQDCKWGGDYGTTAKVKVKEEKCAPREEKVKVKGEKCAPREEKVKVKEEKCAPREEKDDCKHK